MLARYGLVLIAAETLLLLAYVAFPGVALFDLDAAHTAWTWLSSLQLAGIAVAFLLLSTMERRDGRAPALTWTYVPLALVFVCLSADEVLSLHDEVAALVARALPSQSAAVSEIVPWPVVFAPGLLAVFVTLFVLADSRLASLPRLRRLAVGGLVLFAVALAIDGIAKPFLAARGAYRAGVMGKEAAQLLGETSLLLAFGSYAAIRVERVLPIREPSLLRALLPACALLVPLLVATAAVQSANPTYVYRRAGENLTGKGEHQRALEAYRAAVTVEAQDPDLWHALGLVALRARRAPVAVEAFEREAELRPDRATAHGFAGIAWFLGGDLERAEQALLRAVALDPGYSRAQRNLGWIYEQRGHDDRAEAQYRLALASDEAMADVHRSLGNLLARSGRSGEAVPHWRRSLELDPYQDDATLLRARVAEHERAGAAD